MSWIIDIDDESDLWIVGYFDEYEPKKISAIYEYETKEDAARRCNYLNGGNGEYFIEND
jgi:hypothetical protein